MGGKPKISPKGTYVLDPDDLEELDELSLTTVIGETTDSLAQSEEEPEATPDAEESSLSDTTINKLLGDRLSSGSSSDHQQDAPSTPHEIGSVEPPDELLAPELLFGEPSPDD